MKKCFLCWEKCGFQTTFTIVNCKTLDDVFCGTKLECIDYAHKNGIDLI